jgi:hypothetical protein
MVPRLRRETKMSQEVIVTRRSYDATERFKVVSPGRAQVLAGRGWRIQAPRPVKSKTESYAEMLAAAARGQKIAPHVLERWRLAAEAEAAA